MADHMRTDLVLDSLRMAIAARRGSDNITGVIAQADRGAQYTSNDYLNFWGPSVEPRRTAGDLDQRGQSAHRSRSSRTPGAYLPSSPLRVID